MGGKTAKATKVAGEVRRAKPAKSAKAAKTARASTPRKNRRRSSQGEGRRLAARSWAWCRRLASGDRLRRAGSVAGRISLVMAVAAGAVAVGRLIEEHARTARAFATKEIEVHGLSRVQRDEALEAAGLALGQNIFERAPEQAQKSLSAHPWIASATVSRRLPAKYRIDVVEHRAVAVLAIDGLYLVSESGTVFKRVEAGDPVDLPVITGVDRARFTEDRVFRTSVLLNAVALLHDYRDVGLWRREPISEIHLQDGEHVSLYFGSDTTLARLGSRPYRAKLSRLRKVLDRLEQRDARPAYVYLDNVRRPDRVTVRLR